MKNESKLQSAQSYLNSIINDTTLDDHTRWRARETSRLLLEFLTDNTTTGTKGAYNIQDFTHPNPDQYPVLSGICYDPATKSAVACDAHLLVVDRVAYDQAIVDKYHDHLDVNGRLTVDKYGNLIDISYPNYPAVFPKFEHYTNYLIQEDKVKDYVKKCKAYLKANNYDTKRARYNFVWRVSDDFPGHHTAYFEARMLLTFALATNNHITIGAHDRAAIWHGEDRDALIMPIMPPSEKDEIIGKEEGLCIIRNYSNY